MIKFMDLFLCIASYYATKINSYEYNMIFNKLVKDTTIFIDRLLNDNNKNDDDTNNNINNDNIICSNSNNI